MSDTPKQEQPQIQLSVCQAFVGIMLALNYKQESMSAIVNDRLFKAVLNDHPVKQRANLIVLLQRLFLSQEAQPPRNVTGCLAIAHDPAEWLNDMRLIVLPYIKANEETYFPN